MTDELIDSIRGFRGAVEHLARLGFKPRTVVDVGVAWGTPPLYETYPDAYFHLVEPLTKFDDAIAGILKRYRGERHRFAASDRPGSAKIRIAATSLGFAGASLSHATAPDAQATEGFETYAFEVRRLDDIIDAEALEKPVLLKTDAQGHDLSVLKSGPRVVEASDVVIVETAIYPFPNELPACDKNTIANVIGYMEAAGFNVYDIVSPLCRDYDDALAQVDLVFLRKDSPLRAYPGW